MRIGIDARLYKQTGVGRYLRNLILELAKIDKENEYIVYLGKIDFDSFAPPSKLWRKKLLDVAWHTLEEQIIVPQLLTKDQLDVAHFPYFNVPIFYPRKYLLTIHDLIVDHFDTGRASTLFYPIYKIKRMGYKASLTIGIKRASTITAISGTTKQEIIDHYRVNPDKIKVTYDALDSDFKKLEGLQVPKNYFNFPYILYVGNAYPHKNLNRLIESLRSLNKEENIKLVLAGDDNYFYPKLKEFTKKIGILDKVIFFGNADDKQLINLYSHAKCLVFPSLMEGFGLPNLEALYCGILPVVSDIPAFREVWGDRLVYFDPYSIEDMVKKIRKVLSLPGEEYKKKVDVAKTRIADFSWRKTAVDTLRIYEEIYEK